MYLQKLAIEIKDSAFDPDSPKNRVIKVRDANSDRPLYQVFIYLEGPDLPFVESVEYVLHPTFQQPNRVVMRSPANPICKLTIWTWGIFSVEANIRDKRGGIQRLSHFLRYDRELEAPDVQFERLPR